MRQSYGFESLATRSVVMGLSFLVSTLVGVAVLYVLKLVLFPKRALAPLPPGPKGKPIIGNLADLPPPGQKDWEYWAGFKKLYGAPSIVSRPLGWY